MVWKLWVLQCTCHVLKSVKVILIKKMLHVFGDPACKQCACNALISVYWSVVRKVSIWKSYDVDNILIEGDKIYKFLNKDDFLRAEELLRRIKICNRNIDKNTELQNFHERVAS